MLSSKEYRWVYDRACVPEHLPTYVEAISDAEPHLHGHYLCFSRRNHLIFVGYPLGLQQDDTPSAYESACERFRPASVAIIAPEIWLPIESSQVQTGDHYYRLDLPLNSPNHEVAYMVRRAGRELRVTRGEFAREHKKLIRAFLTSRNLSREQELIYKRIPRYLKSSATALILEARKSSELLAFTIVDVGSAEYAFYLFSIRSSKVSVPGASDFLFYEMAKMAEAQGKRALNLGLGIHSGIRRFKEKWGGRPFLPYASALIERRPLELGNLANKL
jgi:hypothetical protein